MTGITLKGMTWKHPRGYDPLVACSAECQERTGVTITWDQRSLQDFESYPVEELARAYDLIIIDHPHVGQIAGEHCLLPLDIDGRSPELTALRAASVGPSFASYEWAGRQWALPVDAAAAVQAWRPDLIGEAPGRWSDVLDLARMGLVLQPMRPPHNLMVFFTLCGNLGTPCATDPDCDMIDPETGSTVLAMMAELAAHLPERCFSMDPIAVYDEMASDGSRYACAPMLMGYQSYARPGFRPHRLAFANIPVAGSLGPKGSALGGTGLAVSAFSKHPEAATEFAFWAASADVQKGLYASSGGQVGHAAAWEDDAVNAATGNFYRDTRATYEAGWLRPRHNGYMPFQQAASERINDGITGREPPGIMIRDLNHLYRQSFK